MTIIILIVTGVLGLALLAGLFFYLVGRSQPEDHTATITFTVSKPRAAVWATLTDYAAMPTWWPAVKAIRFETRPDGEVITWNTDRHGKQIGFRTAQQRPPACLVREIVGNNLPFGGTWTYELAEQNGSTQITLTEHGFIKPPLFRGIAKYLLKPDATMRDFARHFTVYAGTR